MLRLSLTLAVTWWASGILVVQDTTQAEAVITGRLLDRYTGEPVASARIHVEIVNTIGMTAADGQFRISVPVAGPRPEARRLSLRVDERQPLKLSNGESFYRSDLAVDSSGKTVFVDRRPNSVQELGSIFVDAGLIDRFAQVCDGRKTSGDFRLSQVVFSRFVGESKGWFHWADATKYFEADAPSPWKAILCVKRYVRKVGEYVDPATGRRLGSGSSETAEVVLIRISDRKKFQTKVYADPARQVTTFGAASVAMDRGDTRPAIGEWLKKVRR